MGQLGWAIVGVILVNGCFSFWQAYRAEQALAALRRLLPQRVEVLRGGRTVEVDADELVPGDLVLLAEGAKVPADCRIVEAWSVRVDLATLTGSPVPRPGLPRRTTPPIPWPPATCCWPAPSWWRGKAGPWCTQPACTPSSAASPT